MGAITISSKDSIDRGITPIMDLIPQKIGERHEVWVVNGSLIEKVIKTSGYIPLDHVMVNGKHGTIYVKIHCF